MINGIFVRVPAMLSWRVFIETHIIGCRDTASNCCMVLKITKILNLYIFCIMDRKRLREEVDSLMASSPQEKGRFIAEDCQKIGDDVVGCFRSEASLIFHYDNAAAGGLWCQSFGTKSSGHWADSKAEVISSTGYDTWFSSVWSSLGWNCQHSATIRQELSYVEGFLAATSVWCLHVLRHRKGFVVCWGPSWWQHVSSHPPATDNWTFDECRGASLP